MTQSMIIFTFLLNANASGSPNMAFNSFSKMVAIYRELVSIMDT